MSEHSRPDVPIVHHEARQNGHREHAQAGGPQDQAGGNYQQGAAAPADPTAERAASPLTSPRRFLLCLDDDLEEDVPLVETITPDELSEIDPARVHAQGLETGRYAILSLGPPGREDRELARCTSALSALSLFGRMLALRLIFLDPA